MARKENIKINFGPLKIESSDIGNRTLIVIALVLIFLLVLAVFVPKLALITTALNRLYNGLSALSDIYKK